MAYTVIIRMLSSIAMYIGCQTCYTLLMKLLTSAAIRQNVDGTLPMPQSLDSGVLYAGHDKVSGHPYSATMTSQV